MKIQGNNFPDIIHIEPYQLIEGYVEVRLTENVEQLGENLYKYDEYIIRTKNKDGLKKEIENNLDEWIATGKSIEVNVMASIVQDINAENKQLTQILDIITEGVTTDEDKNEG